MSILKASLIAGATLMATAAGASAHSTYAVDRTQAVQMRQIETYRANGRLTRREYEHLVSQQTAISELKRRAERDGVVTRREIYAIRSAQARAERDIAAEAYNRRVNVWRRFKAKIHH